MKIITVTLSPAIDIHCHAKSFMAEHENFANITSRDAGGKGVNISRALISYGTPSKAVVAVGDKNGEGFIADLSLCGLDVEAVYTDGPIRENITVHTDGAKETRLSFSGFEGDASLLDAVRKRVLALACKGDAVALAGSFPKGIGKELVKDFIREMKSSGLLVAIDSRSLTPADITEVSPFLIKPNEEEIIAYAGKEISSLDDAADAARNIHLKGIENVMISLGSLGAVLACDCGVYASSAPKITPLSTIGAGDSSIAGFLASFAQGKSASDCLKSAVAFGSAACLTNGTQPPRREDIERLTDAVTVVQI